LFDDVKVQVLSSTMPVFVPRSTKIGESAAENWRERVDTSGQLEILKASLESASVVALLCPLKTGPFAAGVFGYASLAGRGAEKDEGIEVH
jgi:hypothetical protein